MGSIVIRTGLLQIWMAKGLPDGVWFVNATVPVAIPVQVKHDVVPVSRRVDLTVAAHRQPAGITPPAGSLPPPQKRRSGPTPGRVTSARELGGDQHGSG